MDMQNDTQTVAIPQGIGEGNVGQGNIVTPPASDGSVPDGIDLTTLPQFRQYQSQVDRAKHEAEQRAALLQAQLDKLESERMATLSPEEQLASINKQREAQRRIGDLTRQAQETCTEVGIQWNDADVQAALGRCQPNEMGLAQFNREIAKIVRQRATASAQKTKEDVGDVATRARIGALNAAGVTQTSTSAPTVIPRDRRETDITEGRKRYNAARGKGEAGRADVLRWLREKNLTVDDL